MTGLVLLAAGASKRLGKPKQELHYQGKTLLQHAIDVAVASACKPIVMITGANAEKLSTGNMDEAIITVHNPEWQEGMASSIRLGLDKLMAVEPEVSDVILMVCDQPFVDAALLDKLIQTKQESGKGIVACAYGNTLGTPALFDKAYFTELMALSGKGGAKEFLFRYNTDTAAVPFPQGAVDIDTAADYDFLLSS
ncbi:nucleotidyltransferase family protein [Pontibacter diazotrophicus]|uniref:Nucleotidyltransferase family protein n=1 Tax=Pontibacter diazotrophicus TaxID=1400979 RepID=A0A3D8LC27_9BACT|nr:nucleotidyltransferase family protein [Pontibacter diazotrophicus]RDV14957.1 nucleotidyltransferase family protein [Pontibacter diazotrophicus]